MNGATKRGIACVTTFVTFIYALTGDGGTKKEEGTVGSVNEGTKVGFRSRIFFNLRMACQSFCSGRLQRFPEN